MKTELFACHECSSIRVMAQVWVDANNNSLLNDTGSYCWCSACEDDGADGQQNGLATIAIADTREGKRLAELQATNCAADLQEIADLQQLLEQACK